MPTPPKTKGAFPVAAPELSNELRMSPTLIPLKFLTVRWIYNSLNGNTCFKKNLPERLLQHHGDEIIS